jgi:hypothetical protein
MFTFCYSIPCHNEWHRAKDLGLEVEMHERAEVEAKK